MMDKTFIEAVQKGTATDVVTIDGQEYATRAVYNPPLPEEPPVRTLEIATLSGLADYCNALVVDDLKPEDLLLHVCSETCVTLLSNVRGEHRQRDMYVMAEHDIHSNFRFGVFHPHAQFMIGLQSQFINSGDRAVVLKMIGTLKDENVRTSMDDGTTQKVTASAGVALVAEVSLPNPVSLQPYRTFNEVMQPMSQFILRVQAGKSGALPEVALFEGDGQRWKLDARKAVREFLLESTTGITVLA